MPGGDKRVREAIRLAKILCDRHGGYTSLDDLMLFYDNLGTFTIDISSRGPSSQTILTYDKIGRKVFYWHNSREDVDYVLTKLRRHLVLDVISELGSESEGGSA